MKIVEMIVIPQLEVRLAILDIVEQSCGRRPLYLCEFNGQVEYFTEHAVEGWRMTAEAWTRQPEAKVG
jgi:hypothetical protein